MIAQGCFIQERGYKMLGFQNSAFQLACILCLLICGGVWMSVPTTNFGECRAVYSAFGTMFAYIATQLIVAHMSKVPFQPSLWALGVLLVGAINAHFVFFSSYGFAYGALLCSLWAYLHYVVCTINQICDFLDIPCLTIKDKKEKWRTWGQFFYPDQDYLHFIVLEQTNLSV